MALRPVIAAALALAALATPAVTTPALAQDLKPAEARSLDLGALSGVAYYTVEPAGFRVVATLAEEADGTPMRVISLLAPGQSVVLSAAGAVGATPREIEISREADTLLVRDLTLVTN